MNMILLTVYILLNVFSFACFGIDKDKARKDQRRISERSLLITALLGPWGAFAGMHYFHHKTRKTKFKAVYGFMIMHLALILALYLF